MPRITLGTISSEPGADGRHKLRCPKCNHEFRSSIQKDKTGKLLPIACDNCRHSDDAKHFIAAAQQNKVNHLVQDYVDQELKKVFGNLMK